MVGTLIMFKKELRWVLALRDAFSSRGCVGVGVGVGVGECSNSGRTGPNASKGIDATDTHTHTHTHTHTQTILTRVKGIDAASGQPQVSAPQPKQAHIHRRRLLCAAHESGGAHTRVQPALPPPLFVGGPHEADAFVGGAKLHNGVPTSLGRLVHMRWT